MISLDDAFKKFKGRLELNSNESKDASKKQQEARAHMNEGFSIKEDFLTGSYKRHTKTKPLKDVDIFVVLDKEKEKKYLSDAQLLLDDVSDHLKKKYGKDNVNTNRRSIEITFGNPTDEDGEDSKVFSVDIVPAFEDGENYKIPDPGTTSKWTKTNPKIHESQTTEVNSDFSGEWKPMVKMIKKWNQNQGKPIKPSFLLEVMAMKILKPPFSGGYPYELKSFFATAREQIGDSWPDPAGLGPLVSDQMDSAKILNAKAELQKVEKSISKAILLGKQGKNGDALKVWRNEVFGPKFPLS